MSANPKPVSLWLPLLKATLPGTAQAPNPGPLALTELEALTNLPAPTPEARLLNQAAALAVYQRAGASALRRGHELPALAEPEIRPVMPTRLKALWERLLSASHQARYKPDWRLLEKETLNRLNERGWRFPHQLLPELLEFGNSEGRDDSALRRSILPLLGRRGQWLAGGPATELAVRHPWNWVIDLEQTPDPAQLSERGPAAAILILENLRHQDPAAARELLKTAWDSATPTLRAALLPVLKQNLGPEDEDLLERALDDKRREVREQAQALLGQLPNSAYVARMQARLWPLLTLKALKKGGQELELRLPSWPQAQAESLSWQRDGLDKASFISPGARALVAEAMLRYSPPDSWLKHLNCTADQLLTLILESDSAKTLISGLTAATRSFADSEMAAAFLRRPVLWSKNPPGLLLPTLMTMILSPAAQEAGYLDALRHTSSEIPADAWAARHDGKPVSPALIEAWLEALPAHLAQPSSRETYFALTLPPFLILGAPPESLPRLQHELTERLLPWSQDLEGSRAVHFEEMRQLLQTRHDLYHHLRELNP